LPSGTRNEHATRAWDSGFLIQPQLGELQLLEGGGVRTVTTNAGQSPDVDPRSGLRVPAFDGNPVVSSLTRGFDQWLQTDFVALPDALRVKPQSCTMMEMTFPAEDEKPQRIRRPVLGPVTHMAQTPPDATEGHPPFCTCCLLINSFGT